MGLGTTEILLLLVVAAVVAVVVGVMRRALPSRPSMLVACDACGHKVSRAAMSCPRCAHPIGA